LVDAHLRFASLARAEAFYAGILGLHASPGPAGELRLATGPAEPPLLHLREVAGIQPAPAEAAGLFHLALQVTSRDFPGARFFAAGDYHHHVGANTWGVTGPPAGERHAGLDRVTATARHASAPGGVVDPAGVEWRLESS
jgi:catechol-2,3-dioxygenase